MPCAGITTPPAGVTTIVPLITVCSTEVAPAPLDADSRTSGVAVVLNTVKYAAAIPGEAGWRT